MRVFLHVGLTNEHVGVFWAGYRNAITIRAFAIAAIAARTDSHCALAHNYKKDNFTVQRPDCSKAEQK
jgi:hypothetical protein